MVLQRTQVPVYDLSVVRGIWEFRVKKYRQRQKREQERKEKSALARIEQQWQYRIYCKSLKPRERNLLQQHLQRWTAPDAQTHLHTGHLGVTEDPEQKERQDGEDPERQLILHLDGDQWTEFPRELQWQTYLEKWYVRGTRIEKLPDYLPCFTQLSVLDLPKNNLRHLPPDIGKLSCLKQLNVSYNRLFDVPPELGLCEELERLELTGNHLTQLPFELSGLKQLVHLDVAENKMVSIPICALRMSSLTLLDLSNNLLTDLPEDMDRLQQLETLFVHKNKLSYLPLCLADISSLKMVVVSGDLLRCLPTKLCNDPNIKLIRLYDNLTGAQRRRDEETKKKKKTASGRTWRGARAEEVRKDSREKEFMEAYVETLRDRDAVPCSTTKVTISCML